MSSEICMLGMWGSLSVLYLVMPMLLRVCSCKLDLDRCFDMLWLYSDWLNAMWEPDELSFYGDSNGIRATPDWLLGIYKAPKADFSFSLLSDFWLEKPAEFYFGESRNDFLFWAICVFFTPVIEDLISVGCVSCFWSTWSEFGFIPNFYRVTIVRMVSCF